MPDRGRSFCTAITASRGSASGLRTDAASVDEPKRTGWLRTRAGRMFFGAVKPRAMIWVAMIWVAWKAPFRQHLVPVAVLKAHLQP